MANPLDNLDAEMDELVESFTSQAIVGDLNLGFTQYSFFYLVSLALCLVVLLLFVKKQSKDIVPHGFFVNGVEWIVEFIRDDICKGVLGEDWKRHFPFLASIFFAILCCNVVGLIPGCKPGTGSISMTGALAVFSFVYFVWCGMKKKGVGGYIKSLAPSGVMFPINVIVWFIELISTFLRLVTLAVRLFCNLFAGHVVMGTFAILAALFVQPLLQVVSAATIAQASSSILWVLLLLVIYAVEILVACVQAYVFTLLSAVYIQLAEEND